MRPLLIAAVLALAAPVTAALSVPAAAAAQARWHAPVPGPPARPFAFDGRAFAAGEHRGVDLVARPGETVEATCSGRGAVARRARSTGRVVTLRCGPWRVTHLPLATITVRPGALVGRGQP